MAAAAAGLVDRAIRDATSSAAANSLDVLGRNSTRLGYLPKVVGFQGGATKHHGAGDHLPSAREAVRAAAVVVDAVAEKTLQRGAGA